MRVFLRLSVQMSTEHVREYLKQFGRDGDVMELELSSATVDLAAQALNVPPGRIAKTMGFHARDGCILVVVAGDRRIDNQKFRKEFDLKLKMLHGDGVESLTGYSPGGVCPFANPPSAKKYIDVSVKAYETVYPACGTSNSAIELTPDDLFRFAEAEKWVDICKD